MESSDSLYNKQASPAFPNNQFLDDYILQEYLQKLIPNEEFKKFRDELVRFGEKCSKLYPDHAEDAERFKPILEKYDAYGK